MSSFRRTMVAAAIACLPVPGLCQGASLTGVVVDWLNPTAPIKGASVTIAPRNPYLTNPSGQYVVPNLQAGATITVTYSKAGYASVTRTRVLGSGENSENVPLPPPALSDLQIHQRLQAIDGASATPERRQQEIVEAWNAIGGSTLTPESKANSAQQFFAALPSNTPYTALPTSFVEYKNVKLSTILDAADGIRQAVTGMATLPVNPQVPPTVAADIAASAVTKSTIDHVAVAPSFYANFNQTYGADAAARLTIMVNQTKATF